MSTLKDLSGEILKLAHSFFYRNLNVSFKLLTFLLQLLEYHLPLNKNVKVKKTNESQPKNIHI